MTASAPQPRDAIVPLPWPHLAARFRTMAQQEERLGPIADLIEQISTSAYAPGIRGAVHATTLLVARSEPFAGARDLLRIDSDGEVVFFDFAEHPAEPGRFRRCYPVDRAWPAFELFLVEKVRWFQPADP